MKAGPKAAVDPSPLPFRSRAVGAARFGMFCERFVRTPKGTGHAGRCGSETGSSDFWRLCSILSGVRGSRAG
jgi:hypothetical protein